jgi:large subunit ribosomal protein L3
MKAILGKKVGMTRIFDEKGNAQAVTVIEVAPNVVTQIKTEGKDGYNAIQLGFGEAKRQAKPQAGHLKTAKANSRYLREVPNIQVEVEEGAEPKQLKVGDKIFVDMFAAGDEVEIEGISKGKGFAGVIKRHNFRRGPMSHGSHHHREPGSIGAMFPQHVFKGTKLPGRMGRTQVTVKNLSVVSVDKENNILAIKGAVPGPAKGIVIVRG